MHIDELLPRVTRLVQDHGTTTVIDGWQEVLDRVNSGLPVGQSFGISGTRATQDRNSLIRQAAAATDEATPWAAACRLSDDLKHLRAARPPWDYSSRLLQRAAEIMNVPASDRQLYRILTDH